MVERWHSDSYPPKAFRYGGQVIVTRDVQATELKNEEGTTTTCWDYEVVRMADSRVEDPADYCLAHYSPIREAVLLAHWPYSAQLEARDEAEESPARPEKLAAFRAFVAALKTEFPKP